QYRTCPASASPVPLPLPGPVPLPLPPSLTTAIPPLARRDWRATRCAQRIGPQPRNARRFPLVTTCIDLGRHGPIPHSPCVLASDAHGIGPQPRNARRFPLGTTCIDLGRHGPIPHSPCVLASDAHGVTPPMVKYCTLR